MFYATQLFNVLGDGANAALLDTAIIGAVNVGSTIIAILLVDRSVDCHNCCWNADLIKYVSNGVAPRQ